MYHSLILVLPGPLGGGRQQSVGLDLDGDVLLRRGSILVLGNLMSSVISKLLSIDMDRRTRRWLRGRRGSLRSGSGGVLSTWLRGSLRSGSGGVLSTCLRGRGCRSLRLVLRIALDGDHASPASHGVQEDALELVHAEVLYAMILV